jgi:hypothetical protein
MRTTVTFEDDVAALLKREMKRRGAGLKELVNDALRVGLAAPPRRRKRYRHKVFKTGKPRIPIDNVAEALAFAEGEAFK